MDMRKIMRLVEGERIDELVNAPDQEIYHWTNAESLRRILHDGHLKAGASTHNLGGKKLEGVSMSRNPFFDITNTYAVSGIKAWRLGFNLQRLKYDHRVIPIRDEYLRGTPRQGAGRQPDPFGSKYDLKAPRASSDETEEFVIGDIYPIWHYFTSIAVEDRHIDVDYTPDETEEWDYDDFDNGVGGMSQEDQEMLFDLLAGSVFGKAGFEQAFGRSARGAIRLPKGTPFYVIDRDSHRAFPAQKVFAPRIERAHKVKVPDEPAPAQSGDWPVSAMAYRRNERNQAFNQTTRTMHSVEEGKFDDENKYQYGSSKTAQEYAAEFWYHGSEENFEKFESGHGRYFAMWFAENPKLTGFYGPNQFKVRIHMKNPLIVSEEEYAAHKPKGPTYWAAEAANGGHDAVIIQDIIDGDTESTVCGVIDPDIIELVDKDLYVDEDANLPLRKGVLDNVRGNYGALIAVMDPKDFIRLTTTDEQEYEQIFRDKFAKVSDYRSGANPDFNLNQYNMPYLIVNYETGKVAGHEGRHRAAMVAKEGGTRFPCYLMFRSGSNAFYLRYEREKWLENGERSEPEEVEEVFTDADAMYNRKEELERLRNEDDHPYWYSMFQTNSSVPTKMKGSPRSQGFDYDAWKPEDMPNQLIGQFNSSIVVPKSRIKVGVVKGHRHFK